MSLRVSDLVVGYRKGVQILEGVSLEARKDHVTCIIGPNGAGKSTLLRAIFGFLKPTKGKIVYNDNEITGLEPYALKKMGISYVTQERSLFPQLTVEENLMLGGWVLQKEKEKLKEGMEVAYSMFPNLSNKRKRKVAFLSGGEMRMLEIAKGLITQPKLILIDEPTAGLAPKLMQQVYDKITESRRKKITILLVDQNIKKGIEVSDYVYMVSRGRIAFEGLGEVVQEKLNDLIREELLGT